MQCEVPGYSRYVSSGFLSQARVARTTAQRARRLSAPNLDGKVLDEAWEDFRLSKGKLFGTDGQPVLPSSILLKGFVWQALADKDPESYYALLTQDDVAS